jgi:hypothetical protein
MDAVEDTFEVVEQVRTRSQTRPALGWTTATSDEVCGTFDGAGCDGMSIFGHITKQHRSVLITEDQLAHPRRATDGGMASPSGAISVLITKHFNEWQS